MLYHLTYRSIAIPEISVEQIEEILKIARDFNSKNDISGCLVFSKGYFIQLLEGNKDTIKELMDHIERDKRHTDIDILSAGEAEERIFQTWDMAYLKPSEKMQSDKANEIKKTLLELTETKVDPDFTHKVFWYNVDSLLREEGFYTV
ncbi:MAG: BLUF domain-containing protein [Maribacter sp.]|nr:BLUF domain-containing protein [Maribacter sp.]MBT8300619.1 BLUF domain-containing protein [Maribacter sp.]NNK17831.1 BLUF domain-containing protein [Maribacter sp.]NNK74777.1 BLUF domain-containing protein [Maribacter sp.]